MVQLIWRPTFWPAFHYSNLLKRKGKPLFNLMFCIVWHHCSDPKILLSCFVLCTHASRSALDLVQLRYWGNSFLSLTVEATKVIGLVGLEKLTKAAGCLLKKVGLPPSSRLGYHSTMVLTWRVGLFPVGRRRTFLAEQPERTKREESPPVKEQWG